MLTENNRFYRPAFQVEKESLRNIYLILTHDTAHKEVFSDVPIG